MEDKKLYKYAYNLAQLPTKKEKEDKARQYTSHLKRGEKGRVQKWLLEAASTICQKQKQRQAAKPLGTVPLKERLIQFILKNAADQIQYRGLESNTWQYPDTVEHRLVNEEGSFALVIKEGYYRYSRSYGDRFRRVCWLYGFTDGQRWAVRVPNRCNTVEEALSWLKPEPVKKAEAGHRWTTRQGDVYLVELKSGTDNLSILGGTRHAWDDKNRMLLHPQHPPVYVPDSIKAVKAYRQSQISAPGGRTAAD